MFIIPITTQIRPMDSMLEMGTPRVGEQTTGGAFGQALSDAIGSLEQSQEVSNRDAYELALGKSDDLHTVMIHSLMATTSMEMAVQVTSRAVNAYKEIMQMQV